MKRKLLFSAVLLALLCLFAGCSGKTYNYDLGKYIKFAEGVDYYKNLGADLDTEAIADAVNAEIESVKNSYSSTTEAEEGHAAENSDTVNINYAGTLLDDGSKPDGMQAEGTDLELGSGQMITGFEEGIIGMKKGEVRTLHLTFPEEYPNNPDLAGRAADFEITVNSISIKTPGEFNDANVSEYTGEMFKTADEYRAYLEKQERLNAIRTLLVEKAEFAEYPKDEVKKTYNNFIANLKSTALGNYGMTLENFIESYYGTDADSYLSSVAMQAESETKTDMVLNYILQLEGEDKITDAIYQEIAGETYGDSLKIYEDYYGKDTIMKSVRQSYACRLIDEKYLAK